MFVGAFEPPTAKPPVKAKMKSIVTERRRILNIQRLKRRADSEQRMFVTDQIFDSIASLPTFMMMCLSTAESAETQYLTLEAPLRVRKGQLIGLIYETDIVGFPIDLKTRFPGFLTVTHYQTYDISKPFEPCGSFSLTVDAALMMRLRKIRTNRRLFVPFPVAISMSSFPLFFLNGDRIAYLGNRCFGVMIDRDSEGELAFVPDKFLDVGFRFHASIDWMRN